VHITQTKDNLQIFSTEIPDLFIYIQYPQYRISIQAALPKNFAFFFIDNQVFFYSFSPYFNINRNTSYEEKKEKKNEEKYAWFSSPFFFITIITKASRG